MEFAYDDATLVSSGGGTTHYWDVQIGKAKEGEEVKRGLEDSILAFSKGISREEKIDNFGLTPSPRVLFVPSKRRYEQKFNNFFFAGTRTR